MEDYGLQVSRFESAKKRSKKGFGILGYDGTETLRTDGEGLEKAVRLSRSTEGRSRVSVHHCESGLNEDP